MIILIDSYNLLKQIEGATYISERQHHLFVKIMEKYSGQKRHTLLLIFDGGIHIRKSEQKISTWLYIIYAGYKQSADTCILDYIDAHKGKEMLLVTCDRALTSQAILRGVHAIKIERFWSIVQEVIQNHDIRSEQPLRITKTGQSNAMVDNLIIESCQHGIEQKEEVGQNMSQVYEVKAQKMSKKERIIWKYIKKLR